VGWEAIFTIGVIDIEHGAVDEGLRLIATASRLPATYLGPAERADRDASLARRRLPW